MRRKERQISEKDALEILKNGTWGILSTVTPEGGAYGVPLNYVYVPNEQAIYIHCAKLGRKIDCIAHEPRVSFTVVGFSEIVRSQYTTYYESVIVQGHASLVKEEAELIRCINLLCDRLTPEEPGREEEIRRFLPGLRMIRIQLDTVCGKRNRPN